MTVIDPLAPRAVEVVVTGEACPHCWGEMLRVTLTWSGGNTSTETMCRQCGDDEEC